uniref:NADH dehydrogenase subunit 2 n=1 Tax=Erythrocystis saccata TaxID=2822695 RepID=A0A8E6L321_9FLOR|nr:NADH dehydrogenase subunit 2 [Erythrocystis saccata]
MSLNVLYIYIYPFLNEIFLLINICFFLLFGAIFSNSIKFNFPLLNFPTQFYFFQTLLFSFILLINSSPIFVIIENNLLISDLFSFYSKILIIFFSVIWFFIYSLYSKILNFEFWILILLSVVGACFLIQTYDLLSIYINVEFLSLSFYILASINRNSEFSTEAGLKYFILGAFASALLLLGFSLLYSLTGLTNLQDLTTFFTGYKLDFNIPFNLAIFISLLCIIASFLLKLGAAPFHFWLPDVYEGCISPITAFFTIIPKIAILGLLIRFIFVLVNDYFFDKIYFFLLIVLLLSSFIGIAGAFFQNKWKRFIAFSSINHLSFFFINFCSFNVNNLNNLFFYLFFYLLMTCCFFSFFHSFHFYKFPKFINPRFFKSLNHLNLLNPVLSFSFLILLFSFAGIPPLVGFFSKYFVLYSAISENFFFVIFFLLVLNCISGFYYINLIKKNYFNNIDSIYLPICDLKFSNSNVTLLSILTLLLILASFNFNFFFLLANLMQNAF